MADDENLTGALFLIPDDIFCIVIPELPDPCKALLPGGVELEDLDLLRLIQPALTPLVPLFQVLEAIVAIKNCVEAIPDALGPPPDPSKIADCIPELARKVAALLALLPQTSMPALIKQILNCIISELLKLRRFLVGLQQQIERIARMLERAAELNDAELNLVAICANERTATMLSNEMKGLIALGRLLGMLRLFLSLAGVGGVVPDLTSISGVPLAEVIEPLDALIDTLRELRDAVPDPTGELLPEDFA